MKQRSQWCAPLSTVVLCREQSHCRRFTVWLVTVLKTPRWLSWMSDDLFLGQLPRHSVRPHGWYPLQKEQTTRSYLPLLLIYRCVHSNYICTYIYRCVYVDLYLFICTYEYGWCLKHKHMQYSTLRDATELLLHASYESQNSQMHFPKIYTCFSSDFPNLKNITTFKRAERRNQICGSNLQ